MDDAKDRPVILYDPATKSAWLLSEMSLALHIVLTYLSLPGIQERRSNGGSPVRPQLPYASPSANGGEQARIIVVSRANRDIDLWNDGNETKTFGHVVLKDLSAVRKDFFHLSSPILSLDLSTVRKAVTKQREDRGFPVSRHELRG